LKEFPKDIKFKYSWRKYQQRVINELENHLSDDHLHIIAPPGSGKTILGLEVAIRLNKPTLILAPTIAIRNQWIQRFCELFLQESITPDWISRDIRNPKFITVVTYQGLHAACNNLRIKEEENEEDIEDVEEEIPTNLELETIVKKLKSQKIKTIVVDEAHHLKNEWWQTLTKVKEGIKPIIVGLTATPPYDVSISEWKRYLELNGPVDAEISVPELVIEGDLCPHQDYIHFTLPTDKESENIREFRRNIERLFLEIKQDETLIKAIESHPIWLNPTNQLDWIYTNLSYYSACLIFLNANGIEIPKTHLEIIGYKNLTIPKLDYNWIETILDFYLYRDKEHFTQFEEHKKSLENRLRRHGAIEKKKINFSHNKKVTGFLTSSISKLNGIKDIVDFEYNQLGKDLRMVILSDFIRKEFFVNTSENTTKLNKIGIMPIFEKLRRQNIDHKKIGVLTGSIIIIPKSAFPLFQDKALELGITKINSSNVPYDTNYIQINQSEQLKNDIINIITQIFQSGEIEVLIGTKSLLGEGWDAPAINSLILASFVGSFVLSNQMRGRAIRTQNGNINKTGNIWHLVTIDQTSKTGGDDFDLLKRRFRGFVGVSFKENAGIENGANRLNLPENIYLKEEAEKKNKEMFSYAADRESLKQRWEKALKSGVTLVEEIKIPFKEEKEYKAVKSLYFYKTIGNLLATLGSGLVGFGLESLQGLGRVAKNIKSAKDLYFYLAIIGATGVAIFGRFTLKTLRLYFKYRDISKDIQQIGNALLNSLIKAGIIHTNNSNLKVKTTIDVWGSVFCHLEGGTTFEKSTFVNSLKEIINPIDNPRYVIIRKNMFMMFLQQKDYHSVPEILGKNKKLAEFFANQWQRLVGNCELVFTRTINGRKALLTSRVKSLSSQFEEKAEHVNKWR
jgi:superfamily II DNA or RNA helicase